MRRFGDSPCDFCGYKGPERRRASEAAERNHLVGRIMADDKLKKIFGKDKVSMFEMNKHLSNHVS